MMRATDVALRLGLRRYPHSWRGRCPCCDYAGKTFSVRAGRDGRARLFCANGCRLDELAETVARATHQPTPALRSDTDAAAILEHNRERALALWRGSEPAIGTLAHNYLVARGLSGIVASPALRFRGDCPHPERAHLPALIALVCDVTGAPSAVHRTYLTREASKATVEPAKASLGPIWGGAIRLEAPANDKPLVIGEGIETSASAGCLMGLPAWSAVSAGNLAKGLVLPAEVGRVVIAADPDRAGRAAACDAWLRWRAEGRTVQIATPNSASDFNDLLRQREAGHV